jgi:TP901 family phage tail tape measure protein
MAQQLTLKYFIRLESNIGDKSRTEAQVLEAAQQRMQRAVGITADKLGTLDRAITRIGQNTSTERQIGYLQRLGTALDAARAKAQRMQQALAAGVDGAPQKFAEAAAGAYGFKKVVAAPVRAYASLEDADTDLKIALMRKGGKVDGSYAAISKKAQALGNQLPGTTKDFIGSAAALAAQGVSPAAIANGALESAAHLGVLLKLNQAETAETVAKLREAYQIKDEELPALADIVQRRAYAFGIKPHDIKESAKYSAATAKTLGLGGLANGANMMTLQGMANQGGMDPSQFGTNIDMMFKMLVKGPLMLREAKKGMKKDAREKLESTGIDFNFFDDKGQLKEKDGDRIKGLIAELEKLKKVKEALGPEGAIEVANALFGQEGGRPAQLLGDMGVSGYEKAQQRVDEQAGLQERINERLGTFASKLEAASGTLENVMAKAAAPLGKAMKPGFDAANSALGGPITSFLQDHPVAGTAGLLGAGAIGSYLTARVGGGLLKALILRGAPAAAAGAEAAAPAGGMAGGVAAAGKLAQFGKMLKYGGITAGIGAGLEAISVLGDDKADKARELSRIGVTGAAGWMGGAAAGAALGSIVPGVGTLIGGVAGGAAGYFGAGAAFDALWAKPKDHVRLSAPGQAATSLAAGQTTEIKLGEGKITVDVRMTDERTTAGAQLTQPMPGIKLSAGATAPEGSW